MKHDIKKSLESKRPTLMLNEQAVLWSRIEKGIDTLSISSPYMAWVRAHATMGVAVLLIVTIIGSGTTTAFAQKSRPGDVLFPVERAIERLEIRFAGSEEKRTALSIEHAEERVSELKELIGTSGSGSHIEITATSTSDAHVSATVNALVHVMTESKMSTNDRERVLENLFEEIDPLSIKVRVNATSDGSSDRDRVEIDRDEKGETRIEIRDESKRTRIERKEGRVRIEYDDSDDDHDRRGKRDDD